MSNVIHLQMRARSCLRLSDQSQDPEMKDCLVSMAQTYLATAIGLRSAETAGSTEDGVIVGPWFREQGSAPPAARTAVQDQAARTEASTTPTHPHCPNCAVPMWLVLVNYTGHDKEQHYFECKVCDARTGR
jgi:hypothetical protein